jgi:hypothetical protein
VQVENAKAQAANYPFCTIEPNVGVVAVPDPRLDVLSQLSHSQRVVPTSVEFVDIAGLVKGASQGEVFFLLSCFSLLQNLSTQMDIPFVSSFLHLCFFLLQIDFNGDLLFIFFFFFMMVICLFYAMLKQMLFHQVRDPFCNCQGYGVVQCQWKNSELQI